MFMLSLRWFSFLMFMTTVAAYPYKFDQVYERAPETAPSQDTKADLEVPERPVSMKLHTSNQTQSFLSMQQLFDGNEKFRQDARMSSTKTAEQDPGFMFLGCLDNRLTPSTIFNTPSSAVVSHKNIGNQYSSNDAGADAAVAYAIESLQVQHIIVLGHYGCKGVVDAITKSHKVSKLIRKWIRPIRDLYTTTRRVEIVKLRNSRMPKRGQPNGITDAPPASDAGYRALVEENVKQSVTKLRENFTLQQAFSRKLKTDDGKDIDVFVHGFVFDETTGDVHDLHVSYGPPGKVIPHIPFKTLKAAQRYQGNGGAVKRGKTWDFKAHHM